MENIQQTQNKFNNGKYPYIRNYLWQYLPETEKQYTDYDTRQPLNPGDKVWTNEQGQMVTADMPWAKEDWAVENGTFAGSRELPELGIVINKNTGERSDYIGEQFEDYRQRMTDAPIASNTDLDKELSWTHDQYKDFKQQQYQNHLKNERFGKQLDLLFGTPLYTVLGLPIIAEGIGAGGAWLLAHPEITGPMLKGMIFGKGIDLAVQTGSNGHYNGWGDFMHKQTGTGSEELWNWSNPGYYTDFFVKPLANVGESAVKAFTDNAVERMMYNPTPSLFTQYSRNMLGIDPELTSSYIRNHPILNVKNIRGAYYRARRWLTGTSKSRKYDPMVINKYLKHGEKVHLSSPEGEITGRLKAEIQDDRMHFTGEAKLPVIYTKEGIPLIQREGTVPFGYMDEKYFAAGRPYETGLEYIVDPNYTNTPISTELQTDILNIRNYLTNLTEKVQRPIIGRFIPSSEPKIIIKGTDGGLPIEFYSSRFSENSMRFPNMRDFYSKIGSVRINGSTGYTLGETSTARQAAKAYVEDLEGRIGNLGTVEGSYRAVMNGLPHSPNDVEILVPESRVNALASKLNVTKMNEKSNGFGYDVHSAEFDLLPDGKAEFEVIKNSPNGKAIGKTAWELYEYLHPAEAQKLSEEYINKVGNIVYTGHNTKSYINEELPISAEELFEEYSNSTLRDIKFLVDTIGAPRNKYIERRKNFLLEGDPDVYYNALRAKFKSILPEGKMLDEQGIHIDYSDVESNRILLRELGFDEKYATDPKVMRNITEQYVMAKTIGSRGIRFNNPEFINAVGDSQARLNALRVQNTRALGGNYAGDGLNTTTSWLRTSANPPYIDEVEGVFQSNFTYRPEEIHTVRDVVNAIHRLEQQNVPDSEANQFSALNNLATSIETDALAHSTNRPMVLGSPYGINGQYLGIYERNKVAQNFRYTGRDPMLSFELPRLVEEEANINPQRGIYVEQGGLDTRQLDAFADELRRLASKQAQTKRVRLQKYTDLYKKLADRKSTISNIKGTAAITGILGGIVGAGVKIVNKNMKDNDNMHLFVTSPEEFKNKYNMTEEQMKELNDIFHSNDNMKLKRKIEYMIYKNKNK